MTLSNPADRSVTANMRRNISRPDETIDRHAMNVRFNGSRLADPFGNTVARNGLPDGGAEA